MINVLFLIFSLILIIISIMLLKNRNGFMGYSKKEIGPFSVIYSILLSSIVLFILISMFILKDKPVITAIFVILGTITVTSMVITINKIIFK